MLLCVFKRLVWCKVQQPRGKTHQPNVSQSRLRLDAAQGLCETSERIWSILWWGDGISPISLPLFVCPCHGDVGGGGFLYLWRCQWRGASWFLFSLSNRNQDMVIQWVEKEMSKQKRVKHLRSEGIERAPSGHFVPSAAADWKTYSLPSHSTLNLTVVDFSPTSPLLLLWLSVPEWGF